MDRKFVPYAQIESFYKYVYERRKADYYFNHNNSEITAILHKNHTPESISALTNELKTANLTVYEAANSIFQSYLNQFKEKN
jgi:hypothetical protein